MGKRRIRSIGPQRALPRLVVLVAAVVVVAMPPNALPAQTIPGSTMPGTRSLQGIVTSSFRTEAPVQWKGGVEYPGERTGGAVGELIRELRRYYWPELDRREGGIAFRGRVAPIEPASDTLCVEIGGRSCLTETEGRLCRLDEGPGEVCKGLGPARDGLVRLFRQALAEHPADPWVVGQYVYFLSKIDRPRAARDAVDLCWEPEWWCHALEGHVLFGQGATASADVAFQAMLEAMEEDHRCEWEDIRSLLEKGLRIRYDSMSCEERAGANRRIWWLGDPLWTVPGNDRRSAYLDQWIVNQLRAQLSPVSGLYMDLGQHWSDLRDGYRNAWRDDSDVWQPEQQERFRAYSEHWYHFLPGEELYDDPLSATPDSWQLHVPRDREVLAELAAFEAVEQEMLGDFADQESVTASGAFTFQLADPVFFGEERYTPPYAPVLKLSAQAATFLRGDSMRLVLVTEVQDSAMLSTFLRRGLMAVSRSELEEPSVRPPRDANVRGPRYEFDLLLAEEPTLVSAEVVTERSGVARTRFAVHPPAPGTLRISDILLMEPDGGFFAPSEEALPPASLEEAIGRALPAERLPIGSTVGIYWELYGAQEGSALDLSVRVVEEEDRGLFGTLGFAVGRLVGVDPPEPVITTSWVDGIGEGEGGLTRRALDLELTGVPAGRYRLELEIGSGGPEAEPVRAVRRFEIAVGGEAGG